MKYAMRMKKELILCCAEPLPGRRKFVNLEYFKSDSSHTFLGAFPINFVGVPL
jgi:hypothetical protein